MILQKFTSFKNSIKGLSISEVGLWLLIPFASLTNVWGVPVSPTMLFLLGAVACWTFLQMNGKLRIENAEFKIVIAVCLIFAAYLFASQYLMHAPFRRYIAGVMAPLFLVLILIFSEQVSGDFLKKLGRKFIHYSVIIFCIEAIFRYAISFWTIYQGTNFYFGIYQFKFTALIHGDSNFVAILLVLLLFFMLWWKDTFKESLTKEIIIVSILIVLALSRAAIPAVAVGLFYYFFFRNLDWKKALLVFLATGVFGALALWATRYFPDDSFQTKFLILDESLAFLKTVDLKTFLFGIGLANSSEIMTFGAHNLFLLFLLESGIIGLLLKCIILLAFIKVTNGKITIVLLPYIVQSMAASSAFMPYFYVVIALMIIMNKPLLENNARS